MFRLRNRINLILFLALLAGTANVGSQPTDKRVAAAAPPQETAALAANNTVDNALLASSSTVLLPCQSGSGTFVYLPLVVAGGTAVQQAELAFPRQTNAPPAVDRSTVYDIYEATRFLYTGSSPVQTGLGANTIDRRCVTVLRGNVTNRSGQPLSGVIITLKDHPEFGQTVTDGNGLFNFVLNGGGPVVIEYQKPGYLPAQRRQQTTRRQYEVAETCRADPPDTQATPIDTAVTTGFQVARGSVVSDGDGTRRATLLFPPGAFTSYVAARADRAAPSAPLTFRATEYTAGHDGRSRHARRFASHFWLHIRRRLRLRRTGRPEHRLRPARYQLHGKPHRGARGQRRACRLLRC